MIIDQHFRNRADDINETFKLIEFISQIDTHRNIPLTHAKHGVTLYVTQEMQRVLKAQFLVLLYNIVESTVCDCLNTIYDSVADEELTFSDLSGDMKKMWCKHLNRSNNSESHSVDTESAATPIVFQSLAINISGSLDVRKIIEVFKQHGCILDEANREKYANSFLTVKNKRNNLAHGNISFSECGSFYLISNLRTFRDDILAFLGEVVTQVRSFINTKEYRSSGTV